MTDDELDTVYGELCRALTRCGAERAELLLARFALLAMVAIGDVDRIREILAGACRTDASRDTLE